MTPADELRQAAQTLRERAGAATPGPWGFDADDPSFHGAGSVWTMNDGSGLMGGTVATPNVHDHYPRSGFNPRGDMEWIATMHPPVGLALAEWLKAEARSWDMINKDVPSYSACLRLARLINGEASDD